MLFILQIYLLDDQIVITFYKNYDVKISDTAVFFLILTR